MTEPTNAKGRTFSWSYTALTDYEGCPLRYAKGKYYCTLPWVDTAEIIWGNRVHAMQEAALKSKPISDPEAFVPGEQWADAMLRSGLRVEAELEIALTDKFRLVRWFSNDAWLRVKIDAVLTNHKCDHARLYDWKTGKVKDGDDQLRLSAAALSVIRPELETFDARYVWLKHQVSTRVPRIVKADIAGIWQDFLPRVERMYQAWCNEDFPARPSALCPWCRVVDCTKRIGTMRG